MIKDLQGQQSDKIQVLKGISVRRLVIAVVVLVLVLIGTILGVLHSQESWGKIPVPVIVCITFVVLGIVFVLLQVYYPLTISADEAEPLTPPKSPPPSSSPARLSRSPKSSPPSKTILHSMHGVPSTNPKTTYELQKVVEDLYTSFTKQNVTAIVLTGMIGVGKTTLASLMAKYAEEQRIAGHGPFMAGPVWIEINANDTISDVADTLFQACGKRLPNFESLAPNELAEALFDALNTTRMPRLVVLDQFDNLLDAQTGQIPASQVGLREWIDILNRRLCASRVLFVSRFWPEETFNASTAYINEYHVKGLENAEGVALLRKLEIKGTEEERRIPVERCEGHPRALRLLPTFLDDYSLSLSAFVKDPLFAKVWLEDVAQNTLDDLFIKYLGQAQYKLLLAFSVYREASPLSAAAYLIDPNAELTKTDIQLALDTLLAQSLISEAGRSRYELDERVYRLHPIVASYFQKHYDEGEEQSNQQALALQSAHATAAQYYLKKVAGSYPPREQRQSSSDIHPQVEAFWHLCQAERYEEAYDLMEREHVFSDLRLWKENAILLGLYQVLLPLDKWHPNPSQEDAIYSNLGRVYSELGQKKEAKKYFERALKGVRDLKVQGRILNELGSVYSVLGEKEEAQKHLEQALRILEEVGDRKGVGRVLKNLGLIYDDLGQKEKARELLDKALGISREVEDRLVEGRTRNGLGLVYADVGQKEQAQRYYEEALEISREVGDRRGEASTLRNLGQIYDELGRKMEALGYLDQALSISREVGDRWGEGRTLNSQGQVYTELGQYQEALKYYEQALRILQEVGDRWWESRILNNLGHLYTELGQNVEAERYFDQALEISQKVGDRRAEGRILNYSHKLHDDPQRKKEHLERALHIHKEVRDRRGEGQAMHNLAQIHDEQGQKKEARDYYVNALDIHREVGDRRRVGLTMHHIGVLYFEQRHHEAALAALLLAKMILEEVQTPDREKAQKRIEDLSQEVGKQQFDELFKQAEPKARQMAESGDYSAVLVNSI